jgi:hypothetical protein
VLGEVTEISVARDQSDVAIDAGLRNESIGQTGFETFGDQQSSGETRTSPMTLVDGQQNEFRQSLLDKGVGAWIAEYFRDDGGRKDKLACGHCLLQQEHVSAGQVIEMGDQRTCIGRDHQRSYLISSSVSLNFTLPR